MSDRPILFRDPDGEPVYDDDGEATDNGPEPEKDTPKQSQATKLLKVATEGAVYWHTPDKDAYATLFVDDHVEHWPVRSKNFRRWLQRLYYLGSGGAANAQSIQDAIGALEGKALYDGDEFPVSVRVAEHQGKTFIDLGNATWQVIEIDAQGWRIVDDPPVKFRRAKAMLPLPKPTRHGSISDLREFINVADTDWPLIPGWLVASLFPRGPYPMLVFSAEQGSGKSTATRALRSILDPNSAPLRSEPRDPRDLMIAANNSWVVALDNLSHVPAWLSDALCRLSTGGGFSTRTLYENDEETIFDAMRPAILTGIEDVVTRGDLLDRSLIVGLPAIPENKRMAEKDYWTRFETAQPAIFGAVLTAVSTAIKNLPSTKLETLPRMADFALIAVAAEPATGLARGSFLDAYAENRGAANAQAAEGSQIGKYLIELVDGAGRDGWDGTSANLLAEINTLAGDQATRGKYWPKTARAISGELRRLAPNLRRLGIDIVQKREPGGTRRRLISIIRTVEDSTVPIVHMRNLSVLKAIRRLSNGLPKPTIFRQGRWAGCAGRGGQAGRPWASGGRGPSQGTVGPQGRDHGGADRPRQLVGTA